MAVDVVDTVRETTAAGETAARTGQAKGGAKHDRRRSPRVPIKRMTKVILLGRPHLPELAATLENMSKGGAGLLTKCSLAVGTPVVLPLAGAGEGSKLLLCEVRSCRYWRGGLYMVGVEFLQCYPDPRGERKVPRVWIQRVGGRG